VFAVDGIIALLMTSARTVYSWDIVITRAGNNVYLDKRERAAIGAGPGERRKGGRHTYSLLVPPRQTF
jgi:hypothetical protein